MKAIFSKVIFGLFLTLEPAKAMMGNSQEEETSKLPQIKPVQQNRETSLLESYKESATLNILPNEILLITFRFLDVNDLGRVVQVSARWKKVTESPALWRYIGARYYGDYLNEEDLRENPKQKVITHYLSVLVNATEDLKKIERLVNYYQLDLYAPLFKKYLGLNFLVNLVTNLIHFDEFIAQGNQELIERKIEGLSYGRHGYEKNRKAAREFIDSLVEKGNLVAIKRKTFMLGYRGSIDSQIGYETNLQAQEELDQLLIKKGDLEFTHTKINLLSQRHWDKLALEAARELNDSLVEKGDSKAIKRKIEEGLFYGKYGYKKDLEAAREFNELLIEKGDPEAIERKIVALSDAGAHPLPFRGYSVLTNSINVPDCGYENDSSAAREFIESLVNKGDPKAIKIKIKGLLGTATGSYSNVDGCFTVNLTYGYKKDLEAARECNDLLVEKGDPKTIERKIKGLAQGDYGYKQDLSAARKFNELLIEQQGNPDAIERKVKGLACGQNGYKKDPLAARKFNDLLTEGGDPQAIKRKIEGHLKGEYGYEKDSSATREFIESLVICDFPIARAIGKYIKAFALKYGVSQLGYEQDREKAIEFIKQNHVPY